jgi:hypothetical protein
VDGSRRNLTALAQARLAQVQTGRASWSFRNKDVDEPVLRGGQARWGGWLHTCASDRLVDRCHALQPELVRCQRRGHAREVRSAFIQWRLVASAASQQGRHYVLAVIRHRAAARAFDADPVAVGDEPDRLPVHVAAAAAHLAVDAVAVMADAAHHAAAGIGFATVEGGAVELAFDVGRGRLHAGRRSRR